MNHAFSLKSESAINVKCDVYVIFQMASSEISYKRKKRRRSEERENVKRN